MLRGCYPPCGNFYGVRFDATPLHKRISRVLPQPTVRWRLTLLYSGLFVLCGVVLLLITYWLFANFADSAPKAFGGPSGAPLARVDAAMSVQRSLGLQRLRLGSAIALGVMTLVSGVLGWVVAGRVLAPLKTITAATERISDSNLNERLAMPGPRDELRSLADTIDRLLERLETAFDAQRRFVANASHELRTPLAMMRTTLDVAIAKPGGVPSQTRELDAELRVDLDHADRLLESFLTLARAQNGQIGDRHEVALEPLISAGLASREHEIAAKLLTVDTDLTAVRVSGSSTLLGRMIDNVLDNAVLHNQPGGSIEVILAAGQPGRARLTIDTSGAPLDPDAVAQLAQPFKRLSDDRIGSQHGHGVGLSIVGAIAAAHGGGLDLRARPEGGLRVEITLPGTAVTEPAEVPA